MLTGMARALVPHSSHWGAFEAEVADGTVVAIHPYQHDPDPSSHPLDYRLVDSEHDVFGNGQVVLLPTYGHTPGHQSLMVRAGKGAEFVMTADACYRRENMDRDILPTALWDPEEMSRSVDATLGPELGQLAHAVERDHPLGPDQPQAHHGHERGAARAQPRLAVRAAEGGEGFGDAVRLDQLEGVEAHASLRGLAAASTASTILT